MLRACVPSLLGPNRHYVAVLQIDEFDDRTVRLWVWCQQA